MMFPQHHAIASELVNQEVLNEGELDPPRTKRFLDSTGDPGVACHGDTSATNTFILKSPYFEQKRVGKRMKASRQH